MNRGLLMAKVADQILADLRFARYKDFDEYCDRKADRRDLRYLRNSILVRAIATLGVREPGEMVKEEEWQGRRDPAFQIIHRFGSRQTAPTGRVVVSNDNVAEALAIREPMNRTGSLVTVIYVRRQWKSGRSECSYVGLYNRLMDGDMAEVIAGKKKLVPQSSDLWYTSYPDGKTCFRNTVNCQVLRDPELGFLIQVRADQHLIYPYRKDPGISTTRTVVKSTKCNEIVIYDHYIRRWLH